MVKNITNYRDPNLILHLIKSCEKYSLTEKESIETINDTLDKKISRRTYYNYKKKLYDKDIIKKIMGSIYDTQALRCLIFDLEDEDKDKSLEADILIGDQLPNKEDVFHNIDIQKEEQRKVEKIKSLITKFENQMNQPPQRYDGVPKNANIREEFIKCGKEKCIGCPHGPYYYAYWRDVTTKKLRKKYIGQFNPKE